MTEKWLYALKHVGTLDRLPESLRMQAFERLFEACEIARFEPERKLTYEENMITEQDYYNIIDTAREDGDLGVPFETIVKATGLSESEIAAL